MVPLVLLTTILHPGGDPDTENGARADELAAAYHAVLRIAHRMLAPDGLALIQITYDTGSWRTRPRRRDYRSNPAAMTSYPLDRFWGMADRCGLTPRWVHLVSRDEVGQRYAYVLMQNTPPPCPPRNGPDRTLPSATPPPKRPTDARRWPSADAAGCPERPLGRSGLDLSSPRTVARTRGCKRR
jgi:hypothetical protein